MTGEELYQKLSTMTKEQRERKIIVSDYSGCTAQFLTLRHAELENKRVDPINDPEGILGEDYISLNADSCYFLG